MPANKESQEISVLGRLFSLELLLVVMGVSSLIYGLAMAAATHIVFGALILAATFVLVGICRRQRIKKRIDTGE